MLLQMLKINAGAISYGSQQIQLPYIDFIERKLRQVKTKINIGQMKTKINKNSMCALPKNKTKQKKLETATKFGNRIPGLSLIMAFPTSQS